MSIRSAQSLVPALLLTIAVPLAQAQAPTQAPTQPPAQAPAPAADLSGNYRCEPQPAVCRAQTFSATQSGNTLELKADNGEVAEARLTSASTLSVGGPWNMNGIVRGGTIEWSNGTRWVKQ